MKTKTIPPLRVSPELRRQAVAVLHEGETLSSFMLDALRKSIDQRLDQQAFLRRGLASAAKARRTGRYVRPETVLRRLADRLASKQKRSAR